MGELASLGALFTIAAAAAPQLHDHTVCNYEQSFCALNMRSEVALWIEPVRGADIIELEVAPRFDGDWEIIQSTPVKLLDSEKTLVDTLGGDNRHFVPDLCSEPAYYRVRFYAVGGGILHTYSALRVPPSVEC